MHNISTRQLKNLYIQEKLSTIKIASIFHCTHSTITNKLIKAQIPLRSPSDARVKFRVRKDFRGSLEEKAYLLGFRLGDLNVYKRSNASETLVTRCHSTSTTQVNLIKKVFQKYGKITVSEGKHGYTINCFLNLSFSFLLLKNDLIEEWIKQSQKMFLAFIGGYLDAEGTFQINQGRGRFAVSTCDKRILNDINIFLQKRGIISICKKISDKGTNSIGDYMFSNDVWRININEANSLYNFIMMIKPYIHHEKRKKDMLLVLKNIQSRKNRGTI